MTDKNNNKIDWKRKLSSRKFWFAIIGFVTALLYALKWAESDVESVVSVIMSFGTLISYILAEGFIDGNNNSDNDNESIDK